MTIYFSRLPAFSGGGGCWWNTRWADKDLFFTSATLDCIASSEHVGDGSVGAVSGCLAFAGETRVFGVVAEAMAPAVIESRGRWLFGDGVCLVLFRFGLFVRHRGVGVLNVGGMMVSGVASGECTFSFNICLSKMCFEVG